MNILNGSPWGENFNAILVAETNRPKSSSIHQVSISSSGSGAHQVSTSPSKILAARAGLEPTPDIPPHLVGLLPSRSTTNSPALRLALIFFCMNLGFTRPSRDSSSVPTGKVHFSQSALDPNVMVSAWAMPAARTTMATRLAHICDCVISLTSIG